MCICIAVLSFASFDLPYALKIKYPMTKGYQFFTYIFASHLALLLYHCYMGLVQIGLLSVVL